MKLVNVLREECIVAGAVLSDKASALKAVAEASEKCDLLKAISAETILKGLEHREELGTTGFGKGIAIPHCRLEGVREFDQPSSDRRRTDRLRPRLEEGAWTIGGMS